MSKLSFENVVLDENGTVLPIRSLEGPLAVHFESFKFKANNTTAYISIKLSNGHFLSLFPPVVGKLFDQIHRTYPNVFFNTVDEALNFIKEKNLPISVRRYVHEHLEEQDRIYWNYVLES